jgi:hypothetical protein
MGGLLFLPGLCYYEFMAEPAQVEFSGLIWLSTPREN